MGKGEAAGEERVGGERDREKERQTDRERLRPLPIITAAPNLP